jgi:hypothetical protein
MNFVGFAICTSIDCNPKQAKQTNHRLERVFLRNKSVRSTIGATPRELLKLRCFGFYRARTQ